MAARRVALGRVVGAHGVDGELRVAWLGDGPHNLLRATELFLTEEPDALARGRSFEVVGFGAAAGADLRLRLRGVEDRESAAELKGSTVWGDARRLEPLPDDEFYWHELIGCTARTEAGEALGTVQEIWETGPHDVLVIDGGGPDPILVPTAREFLKSVEPAAGGGGEVVVAMLPGLLDTSPRSGEREDESREPERAEGETDEPDEDETR